MAFENDGVTLTIFRYIFVFFIINIRFLNILHAWFLLP